MSRRLAALGVLIGALLCAGAAYLYLHATPYQERIDHGPSPEALNNPYLAAEYFLRQQGLSVHHVNSLDSLPNLQPRQHSLLLLGERANMTPAQVDQVLDWARDGGRLLFVAQALWNEQTGNSQDLLLDRVHVQQFMSKDLKDVPAEAAKDRYPNLTKLYLENEEAPAYAGFDPQFHLEDPQDLAQAWANSAKATHMMQLPYGLGSITVVTDAELWKTPAISKHDNAWLLWYLSADTDVTLIYNTEHDGLLTLLWRYFPQAIVALLALQWAWHAWLAPPPAQAFDDAQRAGDVLAHAADIGAHQLAPGAGLVTVLDGSPAALSWLGGVRGQRVSPLGTDRFGQTGDLPDLYRTYRLDREAIIDAMAELFVGG